MFIWRSPVPSRDYDVTQTREICTRDITYTSLTSPTDNRERAMDVSAVLGGGGGGGVVDAVMSEETIGGEHLFFSE